MRDEIVCILTVITVVSNIKYFWYNAGIYGLKLVCVCVCVCVCNWTQP